MKVWGTHRQSSSISGLFLFEYLTNCFIPDHVNCEKTFIFLSLPSSSSSSGPSSSSHIFFSCFTCPVCHTAKCLSLHSDHPSLLPLISLFMFNFQAPSQNCEKRLSASSFWHSADRASWYIVIIKPTRCTNFWNLFLELNSTCFGQDFCPSSTF